MAQLITLSDLEARFGQTFAAGTETDQANAFIDDASALVIDIARTDFMTGEPPELNVPGAVVVVVVNMVRRAIENPRGLTGEQLGDYQWQAGSMQSSIYTTRNEQRIIRRAVHKLSVGSVELFGFLNLGPTNEFEEQWLKSF